MTGLLQNNDVKDGHSASVTDVLFLSSGLTTEQGTLSCVASSSKCNWVSFNRDRTRLEANESHSCLEVILANMIRRHVFYQNHHTVYFLFFLFGSVKVVTVEKVERNASKGIVCFVQDIQFRSNCSTLNTLDLSDQLFWS